MLAGSITVEQFKERILADWPRGMIIAQYTQLHTLASTQYANKMTDWSTFGAQMVHWLQRLHHLRLI